MIRRQRQALRNIAAVLEEAGSDLKNVVKVNIFLTSMADFATMNEAWDEVFTWQPKPVRVPHPPRSAPAPPLSRPSLQNTLPQVLRSTVRSMYLSMWTWTANLESCQTYTVPHLCCRP